MSAPERAILLGLGLSLGGCLDLGGSWDPSATSATTTSSTTTTGTTGTTGTTTMGTATGSTGTSSGGMTTAETTGCAFLGCEDTEGEVCPRGESICCDVWEQDCPEGEKCMPWANDGGSSWNALKCTPVDPKPDGIGDPCTTVGGGVSGVDSCVEGAMCFGVDPETNEGVCFAFCGGTAENPTCDPGFSCALSSDGVLILCLPGCDPLLQDCPGDDLCFPTGASFECVLDASGEMGAYGDPCEYANACDPGLVCLNPEYVPGCQAPGCCSPFCDVTAPNTCPGEGQECIPWWEEGMAPPGYETVGVCGVPQP